MKALAFAACAVLLMASLNCRSIRKGYPKLPNVTRQMENMEIVTILGEDWLKNYLQNNPCKAKRNQIIDAHLALIDSRFARFERKLHKHGVGLGVGTDWVQLAIAAATTTIGGRNDENCLRSCIYSHRRCQVLFG